MILTDQGTLVACVTRRILGRKVPIAVEVKGEDLLHPITDAGGAFLRFDDVLYDQNRPQPIAPASGSKARKNGGNGAARRELKASNGVHASMVYGCCGGNRCCRRGKAEVRRQLLREVASE